MSWLCPGRGGLSPRCVAPFVTVDLDAAGICLVDLCVVGVDMDGGAPLRTAGDIGLCMDDDELVAFVNAIDVVGVIGTPRSEAFGDLIWWRAAGECTAMAAPDPVRLGSGGNPVPGALPPACIGARRAGLHLGEARRGSIALSYSSRAKC